jgi:hypothetical protein
MSPPGVGEIEANHILERMTNPGLQTRRQVAIRIARDCAQAAIAIDLADQAIGQANQRLAIGSDGQELLLGPALAAQGIPNHQLARLVPLRPASVSQPAVAAVPALHPILGARLLAGQELLSTTLQKPQIRGLDQGPTAERLDFGDSLSGQALEGACHPVQDQATVRVDAQMIDAIRG